MDNVGGISILGRNELAREGLRRILLAEDVEVRCLQIDNPYEDGIDAADHIILVDLDDDIQGIKYCSDLRDHYADSKIILMCPHFQSGSIWAGFDQGIDGFLLRSMAHGVLLCKISLIAAGERVLPSSSIGELINASDNRPFGAEQSEALDKLSEREKGILRCLVDGNPNKVISRRLSIAEPTVKIHVKAILHKLQLTNRTQAAIWAVNHASLN